MADQSLATPLIPLGAKKIAQVGVVVPSAAATAVELTKLLGIGPWTFVDVRPTDLTFHGRHAGDVLYIQRIAQADLGDLQIELIEPLRGEGSHNAYLRRHGPSMQHLSFGRVDDYDEMLARLSRAEFAIDFQGLLAGAGVATYMDMVADLGTVLEFTKPAAPAAPGTPLGILPIGTYMPAEQTVIDMDHKRIVQIGLVVDDVQKIAGGYESLFGIGPWTFSELSATDAVVEGQTQETAAIALRQGVASIANLEIELLQPLSGPSIQADFFQKHGNGIHHLSLGTIPDAEAVVAALQAEEYGVAMRAVWDGANESIYVSAQEKLGLVLRFDKARA